MKTQNYIRAGCLLLLSFLFDLSFASIGGSVMGQVLDPDTKEPVDGAVVVFENQGSQKVFYTNEHGYYYASNIPAGLYTVTASYMNNHTSVGGYKVGNDENLSLNLDLSNSITIVADTLVFDRNPIDPTDPTKLAFKGTAVRDMPITTIDQVAETIGGGVVKGNNGEYYVRGSREGGLAYYIDGGKVMGSPNIPLCGLDSYRMYNGYIPAKYGDCTGGVVVIETRNFFSEH